MDCVIFNEFSATLQADSVDVKLRISLVSSKNQRRWSLCREKNPTIKG